MNDSTTEARIAYFLEKHTDITIEEVKAQYNELGRFYHNFGHVIDLFQKAGLADKYASDITEFDVALALTIVFHDFIYTPGYAYNEFESGDVALRRIKHKGIGQQVADAIRMGVQKPLPSDESLSAQLYRLDFSVLSGSTSELMAYDEKIRREFQRFPWPVFRAGRIKFLQGYFNESDVKRNDLLHFYAGYQPNIAIYPGSFNRFHLGHLNVLQKAEAIFDKVIVAQGINPEKGEPEFKIGNVKTLSYRQQENYQGTLIDLLRGLGHPATIVRGLRSVTDLPDEIAFLRYLQGEMPEIKVVHIICDAQYEHLSSRFNRALRSYGLEDKYIVP